ncbi:hypothetical protein KBI23_00850 [bacterium]|jgi:hypothetical protein|nr:hypothetical protein [bacterium]MBP9089544.1 hypothetical protein [bacterium]MBP9808946.1 hypothetical protein [bacterium]
MMSAGAMEQFDECGSLVHGGEMVRLGDEMAKKSVLESQLTAPADVNQAKSFFGQFEVTPAPVEDLPGLSVSDQLPNVDLATSTPGIDSGGLISGDLIGGGAAPGGLLSGMFEILTEVMTAVPLDPNQAANLVQPG